MTAGTSYTTQVQCTLHIFKRSAQNTSVKEPQHNGVIATLVQVNGTSDQC
jgi:hypothetical protein